MSSTDGAPEPPPAAHAVYGADVGVDAGVDGDDSRLSHTLGSSASGGAACGAGGSDGGATGECAHPPISPVVSAPRRLATGARASASCGAGKDDADVAEPSQARRAYAAKDVPDVSTLPVVEFVPPTARWDPSAPCPSYYDHSQTFPFLGPAMFPHVDAIREEMKAATRWHDWPEHHLYKVEEGHDWKVVPFLYTFPAYDPSKTEWVEASVEMCPFTAALLRSLPGIRTALFSRLGPETTLGKHQGWADLSNHVLRCHLPLVVPPPVPGTAQPSCGLVVNNRRMYHEVGKLIVFDDSQTHYAFNHHPTHSRVVLIFDIARPASLPLGRAEGSTTAELMSFIDYFK